MLNIAHRGYTRDWPGNTLEALGAAIDLGVDAVEVDVQETRDGGFVLAHDPIIGGRVIREVALDEVMGLDVGEGCRAPTLEEALDLCRGRVGCCAGVQGSAVIGTHYGGGSRFCRGEGSWDRLL